MSEPYTKACMQAYEYYRPTGIKFTYTPAFGTSNLCTFQWDAHDANTNLQLNPLDNTTAA